MYHQSEKRKRHKCFILGCNGMSLDQWFLKDHSASYKSQVAQEDRMTLEGEVITIVRNAGNHSPNDTSHTKDLKFQRSGCENLQTLIQSLVEIN
jgi:hypothetical protein